MDSLRECSVTGCEREFYAKGLCVLHWKRRWRHGTPGQAKPLKVVNYGGQPCAAEGCERAATARNLCLMHFKRMRKHGTPTPVVVILTTEERFWRYVDRSGGPDACWEWTGARLAAGYGVFAPRHHKLVYAHRFSYTLNHGPIPEGLWVLHRCDNPPCVNDAHHFLGTAMDNSQDRDDKGRGRWSRARAKMRQGISPDVS